MKTDIIFLIGMRGCGKSTIGKELARAMGYAFVDTDVALQERLGESIADFVAREGWDAFRRHESDVVRFASRPQTVVATGGGSILLESNRIFMRKQGVVVYLDVPLAVLVQRLSTERSDMNRPSLTGKDMVEELGAVLEQRVTLYRETNHFSVDGTQKTPVIGQEILEYVRGSSNCL